MGKTIDKKTLLERYKDIIPLFKEEKTQNFTTLIFTLISVSVFGLFAINPTVATIAQLRKQLDDSHFVFDKLQEKINNLKLLHDEYVRLDRDLLAVLKAIPQEPTVALLTGQVHALVVKNNLQLTHLQILQVELAKANLATSSALPGKSAGNFGSFTFVLDAQGEKTNVEHFISSLINLDRIITIDTLAVTKDPLKSSVSQISLRAKAYFKQ